MQIYQNAWVSDSQGPGEVKETENHALGQAKECPHETGSHQEPPLGGEYIIPKPDFPRARVMRLARDILGFPHHGGGREKVPE